MRERQFIDLSRQLFLLYLSGNVTEYIYFRTWIVTIKDIELTLNLN